MEKTLTTFGLLKEKKGPFIFWPLLLVFLFLMKYLPLPQDGRVFYTFLIAWTGASVIGIFVHGILFPDLYSWNTRIKAIFGPSVFGPVIFYVAGIVGSTYWGELGGWVGFVVSIIAAVVIVPIYLRAKGKKDS